MGLHGLEGGDLGPFNIKPLSVFPNTQESEDLSRLTFALRCSNDGQTVKSTCFLTLHGQ